MKPSVKTLKNFVDLLPLVLAKRYDANTFGPAIANEVLSEVEQSCDPEYFTGETGLLLLSGVTDYPLPDSVRQIKGLYQVPDGEVVPDRGHPIPHQALNRIIRIETDLSISNNADISGAVSASPPASKSNVYNTSLLGSAVTANKLAGRLIKVTHIADSSIEYRILKGNTPSSFTADINGELNSLAVASDTFLITSNYLIIEHNRYLNRFPTGSATAILDLPQDFEYLFRCGLFFKYHAQSDNLSKEASFWGNEYAKQLNLFLIDTTKPRSTSNRNPGRSLPRLF